jgi:ketosteroid isomerase-like protein
MAQPKSIFRLTARGLFVGLALCLTGVDLAGGNPEAPSTSTSAETPPTKIMNQEITSLLKAYEKALNTSDAKAALALYGSEPIVMPQNAPASIGREAVQATYQHFFELLKLNVVFTIHEIVAMGGDLAYGRTTSAGQQEILAGHKVSKEANNELFIFRQEQGHWKIHRYLFATSNPPTAN